MTAISPKYRASQNDFCTMAELLENVGKELFRLPFPVSFESARKMFDAHKLREKAIDLFSRATEFDVKLAKMTYIILHVTDINTYEPHQRLGWTGFSLECSDQLMKAEKEAMEIVLEIYTYVQNNVDRIDKT